MNLIFAKTHALVDECEFLPETKEQARQRLLFERATMQEAPTQIIYEGHVAQRPVASVDPMALAPGVVPMRLAGRKPKCFFSLLKSFIGTSLMGFPAEPESVYLLLKSNPSFARVCGFVPKEKANPEAYHTYQVPSLRKLEQFDQVMRQAGIWEQIKVCEVRTNLLTGVIKKEKELVGDTTHYHAYSGFETVNYEDAKGHEKKKSQSKVTKTYLFTPATVGRLNAQELVNVAGYLSRVSTYKIC
jgi:hypothetical protein